MAWWGQLRPGLRAAGPLGRPCQLLGAQRPGPAPWSASGAWRCQVSFTAVLEKAGNVLPCYTIVQQQLQPQVVDDPRPGSGPGWAHAVTWQWGDKELSSEGTGRSKRSARNAAARQLLQRLVAEEGELMDPARNGALAQWAVEWLNQSLGASMELHEEGQEAAEDGEGEGGSDGGGATSHTCTWSCPQLTGETVVRAQAQNATESRWEAIAALYKELPSDLDKVISELVATPRPRPPAAHRGEDVTAGEVNAAHNAVIQKLGISSQADFQSRSGEFSCTVRWSFFDERTRAPGSAQATGTGRTKAIARAKANEEIMVSQGHLPQLTDEFKASIREVRGALEESRISDAVAGACSLMEDSVTNAQTWSFFLPEVLRAVLAEGDQGAVSMLLAGALRRLRESGGTPVELWERLLDEASFAMRHYYAASSALEQLADFPLLDAEFSGPKEAEYFRRIRHLLALERHGGLLHGIQEYELDPHTFCTVPMVDVHHIEADKVVLTAPRSGALEILEGSRPVKASDLVLLVPMEVVPEISRPDEFGDGQELSASWQHPESWLASITRLKGDPRAGEELRMHTRRISRFGSDAERDSEGLTVSPISLGRQYRLFFIAMETPMSRMLSALRCLCNAQLPAWGEDFVGRKPRYQYTEEVRQILLGAPEDARAAALEPARTIPGTADAEAIMDHLVRQHAWGAALTASQRGAVQQAMNSRLSLIQGPPGTGKTYVACVIIAAWVQRYAPLGERILAVADSNVAADNMYSRLQSFGIESVRVGQGRVTESLHGDSLRQAIKTAQVVIATCIGSGMEILEQKGEASSFHRVVVDECTQACEPAAVVALGRKCMQTVLIGDHAQLPATVLSRLAKRDGLGVSLFERMASDNGITPTLLQEQRRMHSSIAEFPNQAFYASQLKNAVDDASLAPVPGFPWPNPECRVCFVDVASPEGTEGKRGFSAFNTSEAEAIADVVANVLDAGVTPQDLCVLTAYAAQRDEIFRALRAKGLGSRLSEISVDTVDGYQGMERDLVLFSATRSNSQRDLGFLADSRRMNVMLTRARRGLIVFGDGETLRHGRTASSQWPAWLEWAEQKGAALPFSALSGARGAGLPAAVQPAAAFGAQGASWPAGAADAAPLAAQEGLPGQAAAEPWSPPGPPAAPMPPPPPPRSAWEKVYSEEHGEHYYWNKISNTTQWEVPPGLT